MGGHFPGDPSTRFIIQQYLVVGRATRYTIFQPTKKERDKREIKDKKIDLFVKINKKNSKKVTSETNFTDFYLPDSYRQRIRQIGTGHPCNEYSCR